MSAIACPICQRQVNWDAAPPYRFNARGLPEPMTRDRQQSAESWASQLTTAYRPCGDVDQPGTHFLPYDYADYIPVTIGMVGQTKAGKTHLLATMIHRLCSGDPVLDRIGLRVEGLDLRVHHQYYADNVTPLIAQRRELAATSAARPVEFCDALKVTNRHGQSFAVVFFDLAGERLQRADDDEVRFYASASALIFVVDAASLPRRLGARTTPAGRTGDESFEVALRRLSSRRRPPGADSFHPVAAAVVVAKSDLIEFDDRVVSKWLAAGSAEEEIDLRTLEEESEDVYAYLKQRDGGSWARPAAECCSSTLHFASATNSEADDRVFPSTFRQRRVLKPLLSVFSMTGIV